MCLKNIKYKGKKYKVKYQHYITRSEYTGEILPNGGTTLAFISDDDGNDLAIGYSFCSMKDVYNKKLGRMIATGRLLKKIGLDTKLALE